MLFRARLISVDVVQVKSFYGQNVIFTYPECILGYEAIVKVKVKSTRRVVF